MSDKTGIEWTDATWNPIRGCSRVSEGCRNCYAERVAGRFAGGSGVGDLGSGNSNAPYAGLITSGKWNGTIKFVPEHLSDPLRWKRPRRIFVNSMSDLFHENVTDAMIDQIFAVMALCPQHTFQVLTKRPERMRKYMSADGYQYGDRLRAVRHQLLDDQDGKPHRIFVQYNDAINRLYVSKDHPPKWPLPNVWLGVSVEDQGTADARIPELLSTPAAVRFVSYEPALGPVDWRAAALKGGELQGIGIDWLICGGESGPGARPMHPDWARSARDQCQAAGMKFFFKQWGEWGCGVREDRELLLIEPGGEIVRGDAAWEMFHERPLKPGVQCMSRVGKTLAGRKLDACEWDEFPQQ